MAPTARSPSRVFLISPPSSTSRASHLVRRMPTTTTPASGQMTCSTPVPPARLVPSTCRYRHSQPLDLATVIAQLASVSSGLERMAREDARAREQATIELAQDQTFAAERQQAERTLAEARSVRVTAELLVSEAFTEQASTCSRIAERHARSM